MPKIKVVVKEDGTTEISAIAYTKATYVYECLCSAKYTINMQLPEAVEYNGQILLNTYCPVCGRPVTIPQGLHYVEEGQLLSE